MAMAMAGTLKRKLLASYVRAWGAASSVLHALAAIYNRFATALPREGSCLAQETLPVLPDELTEEILLRLPVKPLMRFRCVSKTWNSLIIHPTFVNLHLQRCSKNSHSLLHLNQYMNPEEGVESIMCAGAAPCSIRGLLDNPSSTIDDCFHQFDHNYSVIGASNGLVCLHHLIVGDEFEEHSVRFWNPATRIMSQNSPLLRLPSGNHEIRHFGFAFDDRRDAYKVVVVASCMESPYEKWEVRVHYMGDTCWRHVLNTFAFLILGTTYGQLVSGSGTLNWLALLTSNKAFHVQWETVTIDQLVIFSYHLKADAYEFLSMPDGLVEVPNEPCLRVLKGCLCLSHDHKRAHFVVWLTRDIEFGIKKSWTWLLNVSYECLQIHVFPPRGVMLLCVSENEEDVVVSSNSELVLYNKRDNRVVDRTEDFICKFSLFSCDYVESLVLPY